MEKNIKNLMVGDIVEKNFKIGFVIKYGKTWIHKHPYVKIEWHHYDVFYDCFESNIIKYLLYDNLKLKFKVIKN